MSLQVIQSQNSGSTSSSNTGGTTNVNSGGSSNTNNTQSSGDRLVYPNNASDQDYKNYYTSISPALPTQYSGSAEVSITGSYTVTGNNDITSSLTISISFTGGLKGSVSVSFSGIISSKGTNNNYSKLTGITDPSVPSLPLNLTVRIFNATIVSGSLNATISITFSAGFVNIDSEIQFETFAPGSIISNFSGGTLTGSGGTLNTISFNSKSITHPLFQ